MSNLCVTPIVIMPRIELYSSGRCHHLKYASRQRGPYQRDRVQAWIHADRFLVTRGIRRQGSRGRSRQGRLGKSNECQYTVRVWEREYRQLERDNAGLTAFSRRVDVFTRLVASIRRGFAPCSRRIGNAFERSS